MTQAGLIQAPLGKKTEYVTSYQPDLLFPITRQTKREEIGVPTPLPFQGVDIWNGYELSWLNLKGKPVVALAEFLFPCESPFIVESKSFKLYLNSFTQTKFESEQEVLELLKKDLSLTVRAPVEVSLVMPQGFSQQQMGEFSGFCLDDLDISVDTYLLNPDFLRAGGAVVDESVFSRLLKSNCLVTDQPDWGSVFIEYVGPQIDYEGLLKYIISFRNRNEFGEQCIERIFMDILTRCAPEKLTVYGRYTRRGGLDINPFRSNAGNTLPLNIRNCRQ